MNPKIEIARKESIEIISDIINDAYRTGESGILVDTPEKPFHRVTSAEVKEMIEKEQILALSIDNDTIIGCVKVYLAENASNISEWGCLAVVEKHQGKGYAKLLVNAAEEHITSVLKLHTAQLELLAPSNWKHTHKERLRAWYQRMGYELATQEYKTSTMRLPEGSILGDRFVLATDSDFTCYQKRLVENAEPCS